MKNIITLFLIMAFFYGCGGASVGVGFDTGDPWRLRQMLPHDPPKPDWIMEMERQYGSDVDKQIGQN